MCKISIVMAAYNSEDHIREAVESIINQSFEDWELIICDDHSSDNTFEIVSNYSKLDKRIKVLRNSTNKKAAYSRNKCIKIASGSYIAIQDADDVSDSNRLEKQLIFLENSNFDFVGSATTTFSDSGSIETLHMKERPKKDDFLVSFPFVHASILFQTNALLKVDGYRDSRETIRGQDADMIMRMYAAGLRGANLPNVLYYYRRGDLADKRRSLKKRLWTAKVRYVRFKELNLLPKGYPYVFIPIISYFIPERFKRMFKRGGN